MLPKRVESFMDVEAAAAVYSFGTGLVPAIQHLPVIEKGWETLWQFTGMHFLQDTLYTRVQGKYRQMQIVFQTQNFANILIKNAYFFSSRRSLEAQIKKLCKDTEITFWHDSQFTTDFILLNNWWILFRTFGRFLHVPTTQIYCLTGDIISATNITYLKTLHDPPQLLFFILKYKKKISKIFWWKFFLFFSGPDPQHCLYLKSRNEMKKGWQQKDPRIERTKQIKVSLIMILIIAVIGSNQKRGGKVCKFREVQPLRRRAANIHVSDFLFSGCTEEPQISCDEDVPR